jgi:hypothetical protein
LHTDPEIAHLAASWDTLSENIKAAVLALVESSRR